VAKCNQLTPLPFKGLTTWLSSVPCNTNSSKAANLKFGVFLTTEWIHQWPHNWVHFIWQAIPPHNSLSYACLDPDIKHKNTYISMCYKHTSPTRHSLTSIARTLCCMALLRTNISKFQKAQYILARITFDTHQANSHSVAALASYISGLK